MTLTRIFSFSLIAGLVVEGTLDGLFAMFGKFGPCGPGNDLTGLLFVLHLPAISLADHILPGDSMFRLPAIILFTAALWSAVAFVIIGGSRALYAKVTKSAS